MILMMFVSQYVKSKLILDGNVTAGVLAANKKCHNLSLFSGLLE